MPTDIQVFSDRAELSRAAADTLVRYARQAVQDHGKFYLALAGGSTPKQLYQLLSLAPYRDEIPWQDTHIYFGDERMVPHDHADSNFGMASEALFHNVPIPETQIHPIPTDCPDAHECARQYHETLSKIPEHEDGKAPRFDLILLGMGTDGHTASLFPGTAILQETRCNAAAEYVDKLDSWRISITYPVINHAHHVIILVSGEDKAEMIGHILRKMDISVPIQGVRPDGLLQWMLDTDAAKQLSGDMHAHSDR